MYSCEDRIRAVELYLKSGKRIKATIRLLGYPTKNSLKARHREYQQRHDLRIGYVRTAPRYSAAQKQTAVDHYLSHDGCAAATLKAFGYPSRGTFAKWIEELCPEIGKRRVGRVAGSVPKSREARQAAVIELCTRDESASVVAQRAGVSRPLLHNWKNQLLGREVPASMRRPKKPASNLEHAELEQQVESLRRDIRKLELERDILKKANELVKKGMGITPHLLSNREKTMLVDVLKQTYPFPELLAVHRSDASVHRMARQTERRFALPVSACARSPAIAPKRSVHPPPTRYPLLLRAQR